MPCLKWGSPRVTGVKIFKWNEKLLVNNIPQGHGLFVFRRAYDGSIKSIMRFNLILLVTSDPYSSNPNSVARSDGLAFGGTMDLCGLFWLQPSQDEMIHDLTSFLQASFEFSEFTVNSPNSPKLVIAVDFSYNPFVHLYCPGTRAAAAELRCTHAHANQDGACLELADYDEEITLCKYAAAEGPVDVEDNSGELPSDDVEAAYSEEMMDLVKKLRKYRQARRTFPLLPLSDEHPLGLVEVEKPVMKMLTKTTVQNDCPICLVAMKKGDVVVTTKCGHVFHRECAVKWLTRNLTCPYCRSSTIVVL